MNNTYYTVMHKLNILSIDDRKELIKKYVKNLINFDGGYNSKYDNLYYEFYDKFSADMFDFFLNQNGLENDFYENVGKYERSLCYDIFYKIITPLIKEDTYNKYK